MPTVSPNNTNKMSMSKEEAKGRSKDCREIFQRITNRQIEALMFHDKMSDMYNFLGLSGFKRMHECQYFSESAEFKKTKKYFMTNHNMLLEETDVQAKQYIPQDWFNYDKFDVSAQIKRQYTEKTFEEYRNWERETKWIYETAYQELMQLGVVSDAEFVSCLICDVSHELECLEKIYIKLKAIDFNMMYISEMQYDIHEKYKKKMKHIK